VTQAAAAGPRLKREAVELGLCTMHPGATPVAIGELIMVAVALGFRQGARRDVDRRRKKSEAKLV
jgi:hypothetical protein